MQASVLILLHETDGDHHAVAADLRNEVQGGINEQAQELKLPLGQVLLKQTRWGHDFLCHAIVSHEAQEQLDTAVQGFQGLGPAPHVCLAQGIVLLLPGVVGGQIKSAGASRDGDAVSDAGEEVVLAHQLIDLGTQIVQVFKAGLNAHEHLEQDILVDTGVVFVGGELILVFVQVLEHVGLEVCSASDLDDFKEGGEAKVVIHSVLALEQQIKATKQVL